MPIAPATKLVSDVLTAVKRQFGDESGAQVTNDDIIRWINQGQLEICKANKPLKTVATTTTVLGQNSYDFPSDKILTIEALYYEGAPIKPITFTEIQETVLKGSDPTTLNGTPEVWYEWDEKIYLYPVPDTDDKSITAYITHYPPVVTAPADTLSLPDIYYTALLEYVLAQAYELDDDWTGAQFKRQQGAENLNSLAEYQSGATKNTYGSVNVLWDDL